jgi:Protein of unknown function (DUF1571)
MHIRRLTLVALSLGALTPIACLRNLKKDQASLDGRPGKEKVPTPNPPLPTGKFAELGPSAGGVQPPKLELAPGSLPPLPGMPGTASQPIPSSIPDGPMGKMTERDEELLAAGDDEQRRGILPRIRDRRKENEKKGLPELPPAVEPKKEDKNALPADPKKPADNPKLMSPVVPGKTGDTPSVKPPTNTKPVQSELKSVRNLVDEAAKKFTDVADFESKLVKRETVSGKKQPTEEMRFLYRRDPFSVRLTVTGEHGRGREVLFVKGQNAGKLVIVTGEGDNRLLGVGKKMELDPDNPLATSRTRGKIEDSGLGRPIRVLTKFVEEAEKGTRPADSVRSLGKVQRKEFATSVEGVEVTLRSSDDPLLPKGGKRLYFFDVDPASPSYRLPVLVITYEPNDTEVEYYCFTDFKLPAKLTDADFNADKIGRRR